MESLTKKTISHIYRADYFTCICTCIPGGVNIFLNNIVCNLKIIIVKKLYVVILFFFSIVLLLIFLHCKNVVMKQDQGASDSSQT